jgi:hypothetical protein
VVVVVVLPVAAVAGFLTAGFFGFAVCANTGMLAMNKRIPEIK